MCGLFGVAGQLTAQDKRIFRNLGYPSMLRGLDATGVCEVKKVKKALSFRVVKEPNHFADFIDYRPIKDTLFNYTLDGEKLLMGHVRAATIGNLTAKNAHPFTTGDLIVSHNGTLEDVRFQPAKNQDITDSELMAREMSKDGIEKTLGNISKDSAYAVSIFNKKDDTITFARNSARPLAIAHNLARGVIYWASELAMLEMVLDRADVKYHSYEFGALKMATVKIDPLPFDREGKIWDVVDLKEAPEMPKKSYTNHRKEGSKIHTGLPSTITPIGGSNFNDKDAVWCDGCLNYVSTDTNDKGSCERTTCKAPSYSEQEEWNNWSAWEVNKEGTIH